MMVPSPAICKAYVTTFQDKLREWSTSNPPRVFTDVFNLVRDRRTLRAAFGHVAKARGAECPGVDGATCATVRTTIGDDGLAKQLADDLKRRRYSPKPCKTTTVERGGNCRTVHHVALRDRVVAQSCAYVISAITEPRLHPGSSAYIKGRGQQYALKLLEAVARDPSLGCFLRLDYQKYFDSIGRRRLLAELARHISDRHLLQLVDTILSCGVAGVRGSTERGVVVGSPLSVVLANVYRDPVDTYMVEDPCVLDVIAYGDDAIVPIRGGRVEAEDLLVRVRGFAHDELGLALAEDKTGISLPGQGFEFLGHSIDWTPGELKAVPSKKSFRRLEKKLRDAREERKVNDNKNPDEALKKIVRGFQDYFSMIGQRQEVERLTQDVLDRTGNIR